MSRNRRFACKCLLAGAATAFIGLATAAGAREFRAADIQEENYPTVQALRYMDQLVAERTNGRHRIRVFHSRQLGEESQTIEQTRVGAIDLNRINVAAIGDQAPARQAAGFPGHLRLHRGPERGPNAIIGSVLDRCHHRKRRGWDGVNWEYKPNTDRSAQVLKRAGH